MATQTVKTSTGLRTHRVDTPAIQAPSKVKKGCQQPLTTEEVAAKNEIIATAETVTHLQPPLLKHGLLSRLVTHILRAILAVLLVRMKRSGMGPTSRQNHKGVGALPTDWDYLKNIAVMTQPDVWIRLISGEGQVGNHIR